MFTRSLLRFIRNIILLWVVSVIAWAALPSRPPSDAAVAHSLQGGNVVTRVYRTEDFFPYYSIDSAPAVNRAYRSAKMYFTLDFQLTPDGKCLFVRGQEAHNFTLDSDEAKVSDPVAIPARTGDTDGINLPWFSTADASLLYWWAMQFESADLTVRLRRSPEKNLVELWPEASNWIAGNLEPSRDLSPFITIKTDTSPPSVTFPSYPSSSSPSSFYRVRLALLFFMVPIGLFVMSAFYIFQLFSGMVFFLAQIVVVVGAGAIGRWIWLGRPQLNTERIRDLWRQEYFLPRPEQPAPSNVAPNDLEAQRGESNKDEEATSPHLNKEGSGNVEASKLIRFRGVHY